MGFYQRVGSGQANTTRMFVRVGGVSHEVLYGFQRVGGVSQRFYVRAQAFSVANLSTSSRSYYAGNYYVHDTKVSTSPFFTLTGHPSITFTFELSIGGTIRPDYFPGSWGTVALQNSSGAEVVSLASVTLRNDFRWNKQTYNVIIPSAYRFGSYRLSVTSHTSCQNIHMADGSWQDATTATAVSAITVHGL